ncbi:sugar transferase [Changchengzhania lutea]|uniref:sugar transferase n=1 Tax=Changchengzhania lutea TaxID=2049305 RepID=UPI00115E7C17|nr:sugar transferase [Changchengzhania lutea]
MNYKSTFKPLLDFIAALAIVIVLSPVLLLTTILLFFANDGKPFFLQKRPGQHEKNFNIIKFKTMNDKTDFEGNLLSDTERLTTVGKIIRKTSIDEIPQLFNVLKGDMSLVGPRPLLPRYIPYYTSIEKRRHDVKPGITGLAQVNGRNLISWDNKLKLDVEYVENISLKLDISILFKTINKVLKSKDLIVDPSLVQPALDTLRKQQVNES